MKDRGIIKWQPFDSVISSKEVINSILKEKRKISKPTLSSDQLIILENNLISAFHEHSNINIHYYYNGEILKDSGFIEKILINKKAIIFNKKTIFFEQLIKIEQNIN